MAATTDQLGRPVAVSDSPQRIVSLVPSQTELLFDLGMADRMVGITRYCCYPKIKPDHIRVVGGTKAVDVSMLNALSPDLIIANQEENNRSDIEKLEQSYPVWVSDINNLNDAKAMIQTLGGILGVEQKSQRLCDDIAEAFSKLMPQNRVAKAAYLIWRKPYMVAGGDTFISDMMSQSGFENVFASAQRYPEVSLEQLKASDADYIFLSSEPYPFAEKHIELFESVLPATNIILVNGEYFSWYGSRLRYAPDYFKTLSASLSL